MVTILISEEIKKHTWFYRCVKGIKKTLRPWQLGRELITISSKQKRTLMTLISVLIYSVCDDISCSSCHLIYRPLDNK